MEEIFHLWYKTFIVNRSCLIISKWTILWIEWLFNKVLLMRESIWGTSSRIKSSDRGITYLLWVLRSWLIKRLKGLWKDRRMMKRERKGRRMNIQVMRKLVKGKDIKQWRWRIGKIMFPKEEEILREFDIYLINNISHQLGLSY